MNYKKKGEGDVAYHRYAAEMMLPLLHQLEEELAGVRTMEDIEYVHRARVATRRLRACFSIFSSCFPRKEGRRWRRCIRNITRALGEARDLDVQAAFVKSYLSSRAKDSIHGMILFSPDSSSIDHGKKKIILHISDENAKSGGDITHPSRFQVQVDGSGQKNDEDLHNPEEMTGCEADIIRPGLECLLTRLIWRRRHIQPEVVREVDKLENSGTIESMSTYLHELKVRSELEDDRSDRRYSYHQAFLHIMTALQNLFWYESWLDDASMVHRHHEMRIAAKKLRYTLEAFSGLYDDRLKEEIKKFKALQDILGDMHDCDVWLAHLPATMHTEERNTTTYFGNPDFFSLLKPGYSNLLENRQKKRSELFSALHDLWYELKENNFWERLEEKISAPIQHSFSDGLPSGNPGTVRIALISDVHANLPALQAVLKDARERDVSAVLNAGDSIGYGAFPDEVLSLLRKSHVLSVIGNYDRSVLTKKWKRRRLKTRDKTIAMKYAYRNCSKTNRAYLRGLPKELKLRIRGMTILVTHGSPKSLSEYLTQDTPDSRLSEIAAGTDADIVVTGHAHLPSLREKDGVLFVNCGSVGRSEDGDPRACYALLTLDPFSIEHIRVRYDIAQAVDAIRERHLPHAFSRIISEGRPLDKIIRREGTDG